MNKSDIIDELLKDAFNEMKNSGGVEEEIIYSESLPLFGINATIDSLTLVSFIVNLEDKLYEYFKNHYSLTDDRAMTSEISPYDTISSLKNYIIELLN